MKKEVPLAICFIFGMFFILSNFISYIPWKNLAERFNIWALIIISFAYVLGMGNVIRIHYHKIRDRREGYIYSVVTIATLSVMILFGICIPEKWFGGYKDGSVFDWFFYNTCVPMQATMYSLLAFYIASAAFRAFRVRSFQASLLAITAVIVMMGRVSFGELIWPDFPRFIEWIMGNLQMAGKRGILIGASLGAISTGLKILLGIERTYISGD
ncbi:MAG: hypothetical protein A2161_16050 [Candidatus Schekmanbacteria bacterium RBG_13_48_7]|uniref:Uncharacterized protein n=1 Tax=Candidatus Schekmanbacteria bacterium RBG_13_48_7 TaxID=1817878 RepID=A0A1F7RRS2_9BACT|nr:MAG: hypothetical protein A2161_16050 [Candidatus Schekmanbacteria bacterium RBG_13_48_7]